MEVLDTETHLDKEFPDLLFGEGFAHLAFEVQPQISIFAVLHDDVDIVSIRERIVVFNYVGTVEP